MSSSAPCAPSSSTDSPRAKASHTTRPESTANGNKRGANRSSRRACSSGLARSPLPAPSIPNIWFADANAPPPVFVLIGRPDAAPRRTDLFFFLARAIQELVVGEREMGAVGNVQLLLRTDATGLQRVELGEQLLGIEHHTVSHDADGALQDARGYLVQHERLALPRVHRVPGVGAALIAHHEIRALRQHVDDLALAFITPLGSDHHDTLRLRTEH